MKREFDPSGTVEAIRLTEYLEDFGIEKALNICGYESLDAMIKDRVVKIYALRRDLLLEGKQEFEISELGTRILFADLEDEPYQDWMKENPIEKLSNDLD